MPQARPHKTFAGFLNCVRTRAEVEWLAFLRSGPEGRHAWMLGGSRPSFSGVFDTSAGIEALRQIWDRLPGLRKAGKGKIHEILADYWKAKFPSDDIAIIAEGVWVCVLLHGEKKKSRTKADATARLKKHDTQKETKLKPQTVTATAATGQKTHLESAISQTFKSEHPALKSWLELEIRFVSDERIQVIRNGRPSETMNYAEMGFADRRNRKPTRAWIALRRLAEERGITRVAAPGEDWPRTEKRMQEIRDALRKYFGISDDPVPFVPGTGYRASFKIGLSPSFHT